MAGTWSPFCRLDVAGVALRSSQTDCGPGQARLRPIQEVGLPCGPDAECPARKSLAVIVSEHLVMKMRRGVPEEVRGWHQEAELPNQ